MYVCFIRAQTASIWWKTEHIWAKVQFLQIEHVQQIQKCNFSGIKSPCGSATVRRKLLETYPNQINSFKRDLRKWHFPKSWFLIVFTSQNLFFLLKTKMVRMVHMNIFYKMDLQICDSKSECLRKTENWGVRKHENISFGTQHLLLRLFSRPKWFLNISWTIPESFRLNFLYIYIYIHIYIYMFKSKNIQI